MRDASISIPSRSLYREQLSGLVDRFVDDAADVFDAERSAFLPAQFAQLRRPNPEVAHVAVDGASLPVAWIAGVHNDNLV